MIALLLTQAIYWVPSLLMVAVCVAYADGRARARTVVLTAVFVVLVSLWVSPVVRAAYFEYRCYYESWWFWLQPECW